MDAITLNPLLGPFVRRRLRDLQDTAFAAGIGRDVFTADEGNDGGDVDDFAWPTVREEFLCELLAGDQDGFEVDVDDDVDFFVGEVNCFGAALDAGAVLAVTN